MLAITSLILLTGPDGIGTLKWLQHTSVAAVSYSVGKDHASFSLHSKKGSFPTKGFTKQRAGDFRAALPSQAGFPNVTYFISKNRDKLRVVSSQVELQNEPQIHQVKSVPAEVLGVFRGTAYLKMAKYGLEQFYATGASWPESADSVDIGAESHPFKERGFKIGTFEFSIRGLVKEQTPAYDSVCGLLEVKLKPGTAILQLQVKTP